MKDWFRKWFSSDEYLNVYSHRNEDDAENIINLVLQVTEIGTESKILDAACGAGRHSIILAEKGYNVTAFDLSKNLLRIGKQNASELGVKVEFLCSDIRYVRFLPAFDLVLNMFTSFGYFESDEENFRFYRNAREFVKSNGIVILDYLNANFVRTNLIPVTKKEINGKKIIESRCIEGDRIIKTISINSSELSRKYYEAVKLYSRDHIIDSFRKLGYKNIYEAGDYTGSQFDYNTSERLILFFRL